MDTAPDTTQQIFRFLDLPPQLRNHVYELATDASWYEGVDLRRWRLQAPPHAITAVSRQVRAESLGIYHEAFRKFCYANSIRIVMDISDVLDSQQQSVILKHCNSMPSLGIRTVRFVVSGFDNKDGPDSLMTEISIDYIRRDPAVVWRKWFAGETATDVSERLAEIASADDRAHRYAEYPGAIGGLNVACCVTSYFEWTRDAAILADLTRYWL